MTIPETDDNEVDTYHPDLSFLLRPDIYHPISNTDIPAPLRDPSLQPDSSRPLNELLSTGHFHAAAILSVNLLTNQGDDDEDPLTPAKIFGLFYTRLATLTLINQSALAAQESKALEDVSSAFYRHPATNRHIMPWELRVLVVRLQAIGWGDWRRGVEGYYDLARECRGEVMKLRNSGSGGKEGIEEEKRKQMQEIWKDRLHDLGGRVADALIEMGDLQGAARYLESWRAGMNMMMGKISDDEGEDDGEGEGEVRMKQGRIQRRLALLYLRIGNVEAARECISNFK
ncbi:MAG: hypothetical protein M1823_003773 [Watsoniomyces obsoletus]|nr:MAG: hypothetical protein M1823_003773 [Watsoniomyces obsoletus]